MVEVASGFTVKPSDQDLIRYLVCKAKDEDLPCQGVISEVNLYGKKEPWEIFHDLGVNTSGYFFTRLQKKTANDSRFVRKVGNRGGTWYGETKGKFIYHNQDNKKKIGLKKSFSYWNSESQQGGGDYDRNFKWLMTEYTLSGESLQDPNLKHLNYAICLVKKKKTNNSNVNNVDNQETIDHSAGESRGGLVLESDTIVKTEAHNSELSLPIIQNEEVETEDRNSELSLPIIQNDDGCVDSASCDNFVENFAKELRQQAQTSDEQESILCQNPFYINNWATNISQNYFTNSPAL